jgi:hypothetical protein
MNLPAIFEKIVSDPRYLRNIEYGKPRVGHAEGSVKAHIAELEKNLEVLNFVHRFEPDTYWKLRILIRVHDSFKMDAKRDSAILDPQSHASLAKAFLAEFMPGDDLLNVVQYHDIGFAVYRKFKAKGFIDEKKLTGAMATIEDLNLFLWFAIIDSCTASKGREMITWLVAAVNARYIVEVEPKDILPGEMVSGNAW